MVWQTILQYRQVSAVILVGDRDFVSMISLDQAPCPPALMAYVAVREGEICPVLVPVCWQRNPKRRRIGGKSLVADVECAVVNALLVFINEDPDSGRFVYLHVGELLEV